MANPTTTICITIESNLIFLAFHINAHHESPTSVNGIESNLIELSANGYKEKAARIPTFERPRVVFLYNHKLNYSSMQK